jgi:hypothetical protein
MEKSEKKERQKKKLFATLTQLKYLISGFVEREIFVLD